MAPVTRLGPAGVPAAPQTFTDKAEAGLPAFGQLIEEFDVWQEGYGAAEVYVYKAGTTDLASVYYDEGLTRRAPNPQILITRVDGLTTYSKFSLTSRAASVSGAPGWPVARCASSASRLTTCPAGWSGACRWGGSRWGRAA